MQDIREDIRDNMEPEVLPPSEFPWLALLLMIPVIFLAFLFYRRRKRAAPVTTAEMVARRRLESLAEIAEPRAFYAELAAILDQYIEARLQLGARRLTSIEIARAFQRIGVMETDWQESLEALLAECDRAKFSRESSPGWDRNAVIARARRTIDLLAANVASASRLANPWERFGDASL
jgi:hypothetical protein